MQKKYILAIDEGTTSVRCVLYSVKDNKIIDSVSQKFRQYYPQEGWVEHDAQEIWKKTKYCLFEILKKIDPEQVFGIGITNQRETVVMWNKKTGKPIYNAIVWQCRRTVDYVKDNLGGQIAKKIHQKTGLLPDAYFSATKIKWLFENVPKAKTLLQKNELCAGTIESFLAFKLCNKFVTDITNASRTMLFNIKTKCWDTELLNLFNIDKQILPSVIENNQIVGDFVYGKTKIPVCGLIGDQQSSLFGQACFSAGDLKNTYGTGSFLLQSTGENIVLSKNKLLTTVAWSINGKTTYALEGSVFNCGSSIEWLKDVGLIESARESDKLAESVTSSAGVYFVPAFTGLGAPYWDGNARGLVCGLSRGSTKAHIVRAVLDSIAFGMKDVFDVMLAETKCDAGVIRVDGGVSNSDFTMQYQSNLLGEKLEVSKEKESTSLGAIFMCGLGLGVWKDLKELSKLYQTSKVFKPKKSQKDMKIKYDGWKEAVQKALSKGGKND